MVRKEKIEGRYADQSDTADESIGGKEKVYWFILAAVAGAACVIGKRMLKRRKEERQQALRRLQEDALNRMLENPLAEENGAFSKNKRPVKVEYIKDLKDKKEISGGMFELKEMTELSERTYVYRNGEVVSIGYQYGGVSVLPENAERSSICCQIFFYQGDNYLRSLGKNDVYLKRKGRQTEVNQNGIRLKNGDIFMTGKSVYQISLMSKI